MKAKLIKNHYGFDYFLADENNSAIATSDNGKLSLKNCQAIERGYYLNELSDEWFDYNGHKWSNNDDTAGDNYGSFKAGFQKALELMGDKKFSEEDVKLAIQFGSEDYEPQLDGRTERFIQSLQQTEWDVEIEMEEGKVVESHVWDGTNHGELTWVKQPKLDANGCLILKRI